MRIYSVSYPLQGCTVIMRIIPNFLLYARFPSMHGYFPPDGHPSKVAAAYFSDRLVTDLIHAAVL